jgi:hypothetical protein
MGSIGSAFGFGPNTIENNPHGGAWLQENSEMSLWALQQPDGINIIRNNGSFGVAGSFGSQITLAGARFVENAGPAVDVYAHSQIYASSELAGLTANELTRNGTPNDLNTAALRVDGNSQAYVRGGVIAQNTGPGILLLVNSSADIAGVVFGANTGGTAVCDSTATMVSDVSPSQSTPGAVVSCRSPHAPVNRRPPGLPTTRPDVARYKTMQAAFRNAVSGTALNAPH